MNRFWAVAAYLGLFALAACGSEMQPAPAPATAAVSAAPYTAFGDQYVYVADRIAGVPGSVVRVLRASSGKEISRVAVGEGNPYAVAIGSSGSLYVLEYRASAYPPFRILEFDPGQLHVRRTIDINYRPKAIDVDAAGNLYVLSSGLVNLSVYPYGSAKASRTIRVDSPSFPGQSLSLKVAPDGGVYVAYVRITTIGVVAYIAPGATSVSRNVQDGFAASIALDGKGNAYVASSRSKRNYGPWVDEWSPGLGKMLRRSPASLVVPQAVAVNAAGNVFVGYPGKIDVYLPAGSMKSPYRSIEKAGWSPTQLAFDQNGRLGVLDANSSAVQLLDAQNGNQLWQTGAGIAPTAFGFGPWGSQPGP